jgi:hypothetical protein
VPTELPITCTLSPSEVPERLAEMSHLGRAALLDVDRSHARAILRFRAGATTRDRLEAIVAAEARCCAFLDMTVAEDRDALALTITAPAGAELVLDELVAAFVGDRRLAWAGDC